MNAYVVIPCIHASIDQLLAGNRCHAANPRHREIVVAVDDLLDEIRDEFGDHGVAAVKWLTQAALKATK